MKTLSKKLLLAAVGIVLACAAFLLIVQITDVNSYDINIVDPKTGLDTYKPNTSYAVQGSCFENIAKINNLGFHGPDVMPEKKEGIFRILVVGSSYAEARQVPVEEMYSSILEDKLNTMPNKKFTYEVIPLGVNGNGTVLNTLYYLKYGKALSPDLVIDIESEFELLDKTDASALGEDGSISLEVPVRSGSAAHELFRETMRHSKMAVNLYNRYLVLTGALRSMFNSPLSLIPGHASNLQAPPDTPQIRTPDWELKQKLIDTLASTVKEGGSRFILASWMSDSAPQDIVKEYPGRMSENSKEQGFAYVDLLPEVKKLEAAEGKATSLSCDAHWSKEGNHHIAEALFVYLSGHPALLQTQ
jgi:hypothetical protein